jgi:uncharacterized iron-regulated membrane protein
MGMRSLWVGLHRYVGLVLAGFLIVAGTTGSLLAWNDALEAFVSPQLFRVAAPPPEARRLDPLVIRERLQAAYPHALAVRVPLAHEPGHALLFMLRSVPPGPGRPAQALPNDQVFVDPYTGRVLGERKWGDLSQGMKNLMPFIYRLHESLALGVVGTIGFGIVALLWTIDCFVGAYLTLPATPHRTQGAPGRRRAPWLVRWWPAWTLRRSGGYKLHVDLHRAGGLWTWAMLFVLAWSSVAFNLPQVYEPTMKAAFAHQPGLESLPRLAAPRPDPIMGWAEALSRARQLMAQQARDHGFEVRSEKALIYDPQRGLYRYDVRSSRDIRSPGGNTRMAMDGATGAFKGLWLPTGAATGDTVKTWLTNLHMASTGGWPMKLLVCALGLAVAMLSVTGVVIWDRKRRARRSARLHAARAR